MITIGIADDHALLLESLTYVLNRSGDYHVILNAGSGEDLIKQLDTHPVPDLFILDLLMQERDGFSTTEYLSEKYPAQKIIGISFLEERAAINRLLTAGAHGFISKSTLVSVFIMGIECVLANKPCIIINNKIKPITPRTLSQNNTCMLGVSHKEREFLTYCVTDLSYKEIASKMKVSLRTIDGYRENLFRKLNINNRQGLIIYAIKTGMVHI